MHTEHVTQRLLMDRGHLHLMAYCGYCLREKEKYKTQSYRGSSKKKKLHHVVRDTKMMSKKEECGHTQQDTYRKVVEGPR